MPLFSALLYAYLMYWLYFKRGASSFSQTNKKSISGGDVGVTGMMSSGWTKPNRKPLEVVKLITVV